MPIIALRLISLFAVLQVNDDRPEALKETVELTPSDADFTAGLYLADTFIKHAIRLFYILPETESNPKGQRFDKFLSVLPDKFETADAMVAAEELDIPHRTVEYWLSTDDSFKRIKRGEYEKTQ
jgi:hypothetical protein